MGNKKQETNNAPAPESLEQALEIIAEQQAVIVEQNAHIAKLEAKVDGGTTSAPTITIGKKTYKVNSGARLGANIYSAAELAENADAAEEILGIDGQTILTEEEE